MTRFGTAFLAGVASLSMTAGLGFAADPPQYRALSARPAEARGHAGPSRQLAGAEIVHTRPRYIYYGAYQYPEPFGYGYGYAPVRSRGFDYGYNGPRYVWSSPDWYSGPAFGYAEW